MVFLSLVALAAAQVVVPTPSRGQDVAQERTGGPFGLGIAIGAPTGLTGAFSIGDWQSFQFGIGGDAGRYGDLSVTADYLFHFRPILAPRLGKVFLHGPRSPVRNSRCQIAPTSRGISAPPSLVT